MRKKDLLALPLMKVTEEPYITAERPESCYAGSSRGSTKKPTQGKSSKH